MSHDPIQTTNEILEDIARMNGQHKWRRTRERGFNPPTKPPVVTTSAPSRPVGKVLELRRREA